MVIRELFFTCHKKNTDRQLLATFFLFFCTPKNNLNILNEKEDSDLLICDFPESADDSTPENKNKSRQDTEWRRKWEISKEICEQQHGEVDFVVGMVLKELMKNCSRILWKWKIPWV